MKKNKNIMLIVKEKSKPNINVIKYFLFFYALLINLQN